MALKFYTKDINSMIIITTSKGPKIIQHSYFQKRQQVFTINQNCHNSIDWNFTNLCLESSFSTK